MSHLLEWLRRNIIMADVLLALFIGFAAEAIIFLTKSRIGVTSDTLNVIAVLASVLTAGSYFAWVSFFGDRDKIRRLKQSARFRLLILILIFYPVAILVACVAQLAVEWLISFTVGVYVVAMYRLLWIHYKTARLLGRN